MGWGTDLCKSGRVGQVRFRVLPQPGRANDPHSKPTDVCFGRNFRWEMEAPVFSYRANNPPGDGALVMMG